MKFKINKNMKMMKFFTLMAIATLTMFTSCLGDPNSTEEYQYLPGVFIYHQNTLMIQTARGIIYSPTLAAQPYFEGDCVFASFTFDNASPENSGSNDYITVTFTAQFEPMAKGMVSFQTDTTQLMSKEIALRNAIESYERSYCDYLGGNLILSSSYIGLPNQVNNWSLFFDMNQTPTPSEDGNIYTLYLRSTITTPGTGASGNILATNAYNVKYFIDSVNSREKANNKTNFFLKIYYVDKINDDSTFTWKSTEEKALKFMVIK